MSASVERLYELLPVLHRLRDVDQGQPLQALLAVMAEQLEVLGEDLEQLYDDQFIETCAQWAVPYIGDLIGYRTLYGVSEKTRSSRAEVANTIAYRRRKGTAAVLEQLARDVTGWHARVVEFFQLLAATQYMNHVRPQAHYAPDLRMWEPLERLGSAFDTVAHTVDVRSVVTQQGRYNIPNIGIFLWRLNAYRLTRTPAVQIDARRFLFSPLGNNVQLFTRPQTETEITRLAAPINVPEPISLDVLHHYLPDYYGEGLSIVVRANGGIVDHSDVEACNLSDAGGGSWAHEPTDTVAIDPVLGRIAFPQSQPPPADVFVTAHYGFSADMGAGEYERAATFESTLEPVVDVSAPALIQDALNTLSGGGVAEIGDTGIYPETLTISVDAGQHLELRAANERRPTVMLGGDLQITGGAGAQVTLNGLMISGGTLRVPATAGNELRRLCLRHCTLVPGSGLDIDGEPQLPAQAALIAEQDNLEIEIDHCIVGGVRTTRAVKVTIGDSVVDATCETAVAYADPDGESAGGALQIENSTVVGKVHTAVMELASNTIFEAGLAVADTWVSPVRSEQKQQGCVRFSYVPPDSRVPRRFRCQPDLAIAQAVKAALEEQPGLSPAQQASIADGVRARVRPAFTDLRYGRPAYAQLAVSCPAEILSGADDESEMGAFHDLYAPQRETNLRVRLDEYLRFGLEAGIFHAS